MRRGIIFAAGWVVFPPMFIVRYLLAVAGATLLMVGEWLGSLACAIDREAWALYTWMVDFLGD